MTLARINSPYGTIDLVHKKAKTSIMFGLDSVEFGAIVEQLGVHGNGLINSNEGLFPIAGGYFKKQSRSYNRNHWHIRRNT